MADQLKTYEIKDFNGTHTIEAESISTMKEGGLFLYKGVRIIAGFFNWHSFKELLPVKVPQIEDTVGHDPYNHSGTACVGTRL